MCLWLSTTQVCAVAQGWPSPTSATAEMSTAVPGIHALPRADGQLQWLHHIDDVAGLGESVWIQCWKSDAQGVGWERGCTTGRCFSVRNKCCQVEEQVLIEELQGVGFRGQCPGDHGHYHPVVACDEEGTASMLGVPASRCLTENLLYCQGFLLLFPNDYFD